MINKIKVIAMSLLIFFAVLFAIGAGSYFYIQKQIDSPLNENAEPEEFVIEKGEGVGQIAADLENEGLIRGAGYFQIYVWKEKLSEKIQAGKYELASSMAIPEIAQLLTGGKIKIEEVKITIPEGFLVSEIDRRLAENNLIKEGELTQFDADPKIDLSKYEFLLDKPKDAGLEGYYFPDTYIYFKDAGIEDIARKMLDNFDRKLSQDLRDEIKKQNKTIFETIILASIVEKEAGSVDDMKKIAGVFQNRLRDGWKLESDATINYIVKKGRSQATYEDLKIDSPYNTYENYGLPPAPISNPGLNAIKAVIYPEKTDCFFFLTKENGEAVYSKTFEEHSANKSKYLK
ncbi:MAG: endolytic transglycosylase MltG [Minisyncoccia bacterium]